MFSNSTMDNVQLAVNGTLIQRLINGNLLAVDPVFIKEALTEPTYRLWSIDDIHSATIKIATQRSAIARRTRELLMG